MWLRQDKQEEERNHPTVLSLWGKKKKERNAQLQTIDAKCDRQGSGERVVFVFDALKRKRQDLFGNISEGGGGYGSVTL